MALLAIVIANSGMGPAYFALVGLDIKREMLDGQLSSWPRRVLPGVATAGGMFVPALIYVAFNIDNPTALRGWAIPSATDIAFALGVLSLLGPRVPAFLKVFLAALAIIDDLGAVIVIAVFYTAGVSLPDLAGATSCRSPPDRRDHNECRGGAGPQPARRAGEDTGSAQSAGATSGARATSVAPHGDERIRAFLIEHGIARSTVPTPYAACSSSSASPQRRRRSDDAAPPDLNKP